MGWIDVLRGAVVGLDTTPLIYYIEANPSYVGTLDPFFESLAEGALSVVTSYVTLLEVLVHPIKQGNTDLAGQYRSILLNSPFVLSLPLTARVAEEAASLRATHNLRTPDAIQLATARQAGASFFLTNDLKLHSLPGMRVLALDRLSASEESPPAI